MVSNYAEFMEQYGPIKQRFMRPNSVSFDALMMGPSNRAPFKLTVFGFR